MTLLNKAVLTNVIAVCIIGLGFVTTAYGDVIQSIGFFALSGAVTNWLAVHMLFEKVPFLYGSGVIPNRFEEFKSAIKQLMMQQFFSAENIQQFMSLDDKSENKIDLQPVMKAVDYDKIFASLVSAIMESSFGSMLQMMGGQEALTPLKEPFTEKMQVTLSEMANSDDFQQALNDSLKSDDLSESLHVKIEAVIDQRLSELTPQLVKQMVQDMIRQHLGWLVVWGGVFGGIIGAGFSFI